MDENTKYILQRMDQFEERMMEEIRGVENRVLPELKELQAFKNKIMGMSFIFGALGSLIINFLIKHN